MPSKDFRNSSVTGSLPFIRKSKYFLVYFLFILPLGKTKQNKKKSLCLNTIALARKPANAKYAELQGKGFP